MPAREFADQAACPRGASGGNSRRVCGANAAARRGMTPLKESRACWQLRGGAHLMPAACAHKMGTTRDLFVPGAVRRALAAAISDSVSLRRRDARRGAGRQPARRGASGPAHAAPDRTPAKRSRPDAFGRHVSADRRRAQANPGSVGGRVPANGPAGQSARGESGEYRRQPDSARGQRGSRISPGRPDLAGGGRILSHGHRHPRARHALGPATAPYSVSAKLFARGPLAGRLSAAAGGHGAVGGCDRAGRGHCRAIEPADS